MYKRLSDKYKWNFIILFISSIGGPIFFIIMYFVDEDVESLGRTIGISLLTFIFLFFLAIFNFAMYSEHKNREELEASERKRLKSENKRLREEQNEKD